MRKLHHCYGVSLILTLCPLALPNSSVLAQSTCPPDLNADDQVNAADLAQLLGAWGQCPPAPVILPGMVLVPSGTFEMGRHNGSGASDELPVHTVNLDPFYLTVQEVTNQQYADVLNFAVDGWIEVIDGVVYGLEDGEAWCDTTISSSVSQIIWDVETLTFSVVGEELSPDDPDNKTQHPMVKVSWFGAAMYCNVRSSLDGRQLCYDANTWDCDLSADGYRLPTEAEWEYAARGGLHDPYLTYPWGNSVDGSNANYVDSGDPWTGTSPATTPVGYYNGYSQLPAGPNMANGYGLYDMAGNIWEWSNDWYDSDYYGNSPPIDNPLGPASGTNRVLRSGSWINFVNAMRCANRHDIPPVNRAVANGFRIAAGT